MALAKRTWIIVADAGRARVYAHQHADQGLVPVEGAAFDNPEAHGHTRDLGTDRPGRGFESVGGARHAQEPRVDLHRQAKLDFAKRLADFVESGSTANHFERLVLVAPPQMLGDLREALGQRSRERVAGTLAKDLTKLPVSELGDHLRSLIAL